MTDPVLIDNTFAFCPCKPPAMEIEKLALTSRAV
jgi:hypothetical protein